MTNLRISTTFLFFCFFCQAAFAQTAALETTTLQRIDSLFAAFTSADAPGSAFAIIKDGSTVYQNVNGLANLEYQIPITEHTPFNIASNSKQFTTYLAFLLQAEGKLSFSDDVRDHLPELSALPYPITLRQLTNHTHGLPNADELSFLKGAEIMTHDDIVEMLLNIKQNNFLPGDKHEYNNTGYILLAEIIERVGEKPFEQQLEEKIFTPLGMHQSRAVGFYDEIITNKAYSYRDIGSQYIEYPNLTGTMGASGIYASLHDLSLWAKHFQHVTVGKAAYFQEMQQVAILNSGEATNYGMGLQSERYKGIDIVFHGGGTNSYRSYQLHAPKHGLSLVFLSNAGDFSGLNMIYTSIDILLADFIDNSPAPANRLSLAQITGTYELFPASCYQITASGDSLFRQFIGEPAKQYLAPLGNDRYAHPVYPYSYLQFHANGFDMRLADFTYPTHRITLPQFDQQLIELDKFTGIYKNKEHNTTYEIVQIDGQLVAQHASKADIPLRIFDAHSLSSSNGFFSKLTFSYDEEGVATNFIVSGQNINGILFERL